MAEQQTTDHQYEAMFLFGQSAAADLEHATQTVRQMIERHGGHVLVLKKWDERKLAYEISGNKRGTYIITYFTAPGPAVTQIERDVNLSEEVLRVMVTRADHLNQKEMDAVEPQPIIREERPSWERDDRGPRRDDRPRDDRPREDRPREDRPRDDRPRREGAKRDEAEAPAAVAGADKE
jgi:small subunit ribosomal protein S6